jgi:hypothetical protein
MHSIIANGAGAASPATTRAIITGASMAHRDLDKREVACIAADILDGSVWYQPTQAQLSAWLHVSLPYIAIARSLSPQKRTEILSGTDQTPFTALMAPRQLPLPGFKTVNGDAGVNNALAALARIVGSERMLEAAVAAESHAG